jgi:hypothetical protein
MNPARFELNDRLFQYLRACGLSKRKVETLTPDTRLYHDLKVYGEEAAAYMETLQDDFGVDMEGFEFGRYFPEEFPGDTRATAILLTFLPPSLRTRYTHRAKDYKPLTLAMLETALRDRCWRDP